MGESLWRELVKLQVQGIGTHQPPARQVVDHFLNLLLLPRVFMLVGVDAELGSIQQLADGSGIGVDAFHDSVFRFCSLDLLQGSACRVFPLDC